MNNGPSLYYASDKNIFDALNQSKVDGDTIQTLFRRRNVVCSKQTKREELSRFFSRLTHDLLDHQDLSDRLGVVPRRERVTAIDLVGTPPSSAGLHTAVDSLRDKLGEHGDVLTVHQDGNTLLINIKYSVVDYKRSEFSQLQHRTGIIEVIRDTGKLVIRSTKSDYLDDVRDELVREIESETENALERREISLYAYPSHATRSQFFYDLITDIPGYTRRDVTDVFVFKPSPEATNIDVDDDTLDDAAEPHIERILLRGVGVSQSELLRDLTKEKSYYIAKVGWIANTTLGAGASYEIEAMFSDPKNCVGFSYLLRGVYDLMQDGKTAKQKRAPTREEIDQVARAIEAKARQLLQELNAELEEP